MNLNRTQCKHQKVDWPRPNRQKRKVIRKRKAISHTTTINSIVFGADMMDANRNSASGYIASLSSDYPNTPPKDEQAANIHNHRMKNKNKRDTMETFKKRQKHNGKRRNYKMKKRKQMNSSNYGPPIKKRKLNRRMLNSAEKNLDYENDADDDNTEIDESIHSIRKKYKESRQKEVCCLNFVQGLKVHVYNIVLSHWMLRM